MATFRVDVRVMPRGGLLDPQGQAVEHALQALRFEGVHHVRVGKSLTLTVDAVDPESARAAVDAMCRRLLANPVTEDYEVTVEAGR